MNPQNPDPVFGALQRVYGRKAYHCLSRLRICVVGVGGVGSWAVESLARTGVGHITIIDHDDIAPSNINRQIHSLHSTVDESKVQIMKKRVADINPACDLQAEDDFLAEKNLEHYLQGDFDVVIDAIDNIRFKAAMIAFCRRQKIRIITTGGAGGRTDPLAVGVADLSRHGTMRSRRKFAHGCARTTGLRIIPNDALESSACIPVSNLCIRVLMGRLLMPNLASQVRAWIAIRAMVLCPLSQALLGWWRLRVP
jgi:tRNA A37 threonylcarbamoyladenosine dehydratase